MTQTLRLLAILWAFAAGPSLAQTLLGVTYGRNAGTETPANPCTGTIDTSEGCPLPMLGL